MGIGHCNQTQRTCYELSRNEMESVGLIHRSNYLLEEADTLKVFIAQALYPLVQADFEAFDEMRAIADEAGFDGMDFAFDVFACEAVESSVEKEKNVIYLGNMLSFMMIVENDIVAGRRSPHEIS